MPVTQHAAADRPGKYRADERNFRGTRPDPGRRGYFSPPFTGTPMQTASALHSFAQDDATMRPAMSHEKVGACAVQAMKASNSLAHVVTRLASQPHRQLATLSGPSGQNASIAPRQYGVQAG